MEFLRVSGNISFTQQALQRIVIAGETGSGKTTLLKIIGGLIEPGSGQVYFKGERVPGPGERLIPGHPSIAYLSQHFELRNNYWVHEILQYANQLSAEQANAIYDVCKIQHLLSRRTDQLSGGERQRIALARLLTGAPSLVLLDEPFSNLDAIHKADIKSVIEDLGRKLQISCIIVSHDPIDILSWADTILILRNGQLVQQGDAETIYRKPQDEYVAGLFGPYNVIGSEGLKLILRPEDLILNEEGEGTEGRVERIEFFGPYYLITVSDGVQKFVVQSDRPAVTIGDRVVISARNKTD